jgi:hypothetical protein
MGTHPPQIPLTPQTNEQMFPRHDPAAPPGFSGHAYPKMLVKECTEADQDEWLDKHRQIDQNTRLEFFADRVPRIATVVKRKVKGAVTSLIVPGDTIPVLATQELVEAGFARVVGEPVVADNGEDEELIYEMLGIEMPSAEPAPVIGIPINSGRELALESEVAALRKQLAERDAPAKPKGKPGPKKGSTRKPRVQSFEEHAGTAEG